MRIRLVHTQALLLLSAVLLTVLCMGALNAWNLRNGFSDFLASRDVERLEKFAAMVSTRAEAAGGMEALAAQRVDLGLLLREFGQAQGAVPRRPFPPRIEKLEQGGFFLPPPHPIDSIDAFKDRVALYAPNGQPLLGKLLPVDAGAHLERPIYVQGKTVATVRMLKLKPVPDDVEARFLTSQYQSILVVSGGLLLAALLIARWVAGHWVRPLIEIQAATEHIAQGAFDTRLNTHRADEIGDAMRNVNRMAEGLQQLETSRRRWIADMSHELRTPLTVLRGEIDALIDGVIAMSPQALLSLSEEVLQLNALVDDLHLLAMADLRALPCYFEDNDAVALVTGIVQRFSLLATQKGLELSLQVEPHATMLVRWDAKRIEQLLGNVLGNSLRYTDAPGQIVVAIQGNKTQVTLSVEDTAPGLSLNELPHIFEPLYRVDHSRSREGGGSGLGLAICQQIVKAHHGTLRAEASQLGGVKFTIELPAFADQST
jgi:two-component system sensor histidine kinase BaeS